MNINYSKIEEIYGLDIANEVRFNHNLVKQNYDYMTSLGFEDAEDYIERLPMLFLLDNDIFKDKMDELIKTLGVNYIELIENDISIMEALL